MTKLTTVAVERAKPKRGPGGKLVRNEIADERSKGLYLIVQPSGLRSWALRYRFANKPTKLTLGRGAALTLAQARSAAAKAQELLERGINPAAERRSARIAAKAAQYDEDSVAALARRFLTLHGPKLRPRTLAQYQSALARLVLPKWGRRSVHDIRRRDVIALVEQVATATPIAANRLLGTLSKFFNWLAARDIVAASPTAGVEMPSKETVRDRVLDDGELARLDKALADEGVAGVIVRILLRTGARRSEIARLRWDEIDQRERLLRIPAERSKSGQALTIPLSRQAWEVVDALPRIADCRHVLSTTGEGPVANFTRLKHRLDAKLQFAKPWVLHDIRRSVASGLQQLGFRIEVIESTLGHRSGVFSGIVGVYQRHDYADEKRAALRSASSRKF